MIKKINFFLNLLKKVGLDFFLIGIGAMVILAYLLPGPGIQEGQLSLKGISDVGIFLIFFFYGLKLNPNSVLADIRNWKLHLTIQGFTFIIFPLLVLAGSILISDWQNNLLFLGTFYLAALPSTVSSSVVMVSIAQGNIPAAIFNASISSLLGIFITPLWIGLVMGVGTGDLSFNMIIWKLILQVLVPVIIGMMLFSKLGVYVSRYKDILKYFDQSVILLIVYTSFSDSFNANIFASYTLKELFLLMIVMLGLFFIVYILVYITSLFLKLSEKDRITALFCSSKKSLVQGTVMSKVIFQTGTASGILLLPIMLYHALQLIVVSVIAQKLAKQKGVEINALSK